MSNQARNGSVRYFQILKPSSIFNFEYTVYLYTTFFVPLAEYNNCLTKLQPPVYCRAFCQQTDPTGSKTSHSLTASRLHIQSIQHERKIFLLMFSISKLAWKSLPTKPRKRCKNRSHFAKLVLNCSTNELRKVRSTYNAVRKIGIASFEAIFQFHYHRICQFVISYQVVKYKQSNENGRYFSTNCRIFFIFRLLNEMDFRSENESKLQDSLFFRFIRQTSVV